MSPKQLPKERDPMSEIKNKKMSVQKSSPIVNVLGHCEAG